MASHNVNSSVDDICPIWSQLFSRSKIWIETPSSLNRFHICQVKMWPLVTVITHNIISQMCEEEKYNLCKAFSPYPGVHIMPKMRAWENCFFFSSLHKHALSHSSENTWSKVQLTEFGDLPERNLPGWLQSSVTQLVKIKHSCKSSSFYLLERPGQPSLCWSAVDTLLWSHYVYVLSNSS